MLSPSDVDISTGRLPGCWDKTSLEYPAVLLVALAQKIGVWPTQINPGALVAITKDLFEAAIADPDHWVNGWEGPGSFAQLAAEGYVTIRSNDQVLIINPKFFDHLDSVYSKETT